MSQRSRSGMSHAHALGKLAAATCQRADQLPPLAAIWQAPACTMIVIKHGMTFLWCSCCLGQYIPRKHPEAACLQWSSECRPAPMQECARGCMHDGALTHRLHMQRKLMQERI